MFKRLLLLYSCLIAAVFSMAQNNISSNYIDGKILQIPTAKTYSTIDIAAYVQNNFKEQGDQLRAIYTWITANIQYNKDSMYFINWGGDPEIKMASTLRTRKGVCENYASLFANIANKCGMVAVVISGYSKTGSAVNKAGHSWAAVRLGNDWYLCDPTWDAGSNFSHHYFLITPEEFITSHLPYDPLWQLLHYPISYNDFYKNISISNKTTISNTKLVNEYLQLDTLQQLYTTLQRIEQAGFYNDQLKTWYDYNKMKVGIIYQEQDMDLYNSAVADINKAKRLFNETLSTLNSQNITEKKDSQIKVVIKSIEALIEVAKNTIGRIGKEVENYQYNTEDLKTGISILAEKVKRKKALLQ